MHRHGHAFDRSAINNLVSGALGWQHVLAGERHGSQAFTNRNALISFSLSQRIQAATCRVQPWNSSYRLPIEDTPVNQMGSGLCTVTQPDGIDL